MMSSTDGMLSRRRPPPGHRHAIAKHIAAWATMATPAQRRRIFLIVATREVGMLLLFKHRKNLCAAALGGIDTMRERGLTRA